MTFEDCQKKLKFWGFYTPLMQAICKQVWDAAEPKPLTEDEIRECWRACGGSAPMAFAREIQKKLGVIDDTR